MSAYNERSENYKIGQFTYVLPVSNVISSSFFRGVAGLDSEVPSVMFKTDSNISGVIYAINKEERRDLESTARFEKFWYGEGRFSNREIILHHESGFYLGFEAVGYRGIFVVYKIYPDSNTIIPASREAIYVSSCVGGSISELKNVTCNRQVILDDILVNYSFSFDDLSRVFEAEKDVLASILSWRESEYIQ